MSVVTPTRTRRGNAPPTASTAALSRLLLCGLLVLLAPAAVVTAVSPCNCNNGLLRPTALNTSVYYLPGTNSSGGGGGGSSSGGHTAGVAPACECVCFDGYLLPHCLYTSRDAASVELWMAGPAQTGRTVAELNMVDYTVLPVGAIATMLAASFGLTTPDADFAVQLMMWVKASFQWRAAAAALGLAPTHNVSTVRVLVSVPGWAAQHILRDAAQGLLSSYKVTSADGTQQFVAVAVRDYQPGPTVAPTFPNSWMRLYPSGGYWYMGFEQSGWFFGAVLLTLFFFILEAKCMFNVDYNVGGGAVKYHHVRQEIEADENAYYTQQKMLRRQQKQQQKQQEKAERQQQQRHMSPQAPPPRQQQQQQQQQEQQPPPQQPQQPLQQRIPQPPSRATKEKTG